MHLRREPSADELASNRRNTGRVHVSSDVQCTLGAVMDLSATGMRVLSNKPICGCLNIAIRTPELGVQLPAEIVWSKRVGFRQHMLGIRFLDMNAQTASALSRVASAYRPSRAA